MRATSRAVVLFVLGAAVLLFLAGSAEAKHKRNPNCAYFKGGIVVCPMPPPKGVKPDRFGHVKCAPGRHAVRLVIRAKVNGKTVTQITYWCKPNRRTDRG